MTDPISSTLKLTGGQKWMIAGLLVLQIPSSLLFYPLAAIFAITGIFVPIALVLVSVGTWPFSFAMRCKDRWQEGGGQLDAGIRQVQTATPVGAIVDGPAD